MTYNEILREYARIQKDLDHALKRLDRVESFLALEHFRKTRKKAYKRLEQEKYGDNEGDDGEVTEACGCVQPHTVLQPRRDIDEVDGKGQDTTQHKPDGEVDKRIAGTTGPDEAVRG